MVEFVSFSNVIIDDIYLSDGRTSLSTLGGSGTHALVGMRVWSDRLGLVASVGNDIEEGQRRRLAGLADLRGLVIRPDCSTPRARQFFDPSQEERIEVLADAADFERCKPRPDELPPDYARAHGFHITWGSVEEHSSLVTMLQERNSALIIAWEPSPGQVREPRRVLQRAIGQVDVFSPNLREGRLMSGHHEPSAVCAELLGWGARCVALRLGADGSLLCTADAGWRIPAVPTRVVDTTGAGNSYCGGLLTGLGSGYPAVESGLRAAVSSSFAIEQFGIPRFGEELAMERERRMGWIRDRVEALPW